MLSRCGLRGMPIAFRCMFVGKYFGVEPEGGGTVITKEWPLRTQNHSYTPETNPSSDSPCHPIYHVQTFSPDRPGKLDDDCS